MVKPPYRYEVFRDELAESPRNQDYNACFFAFSHKRYDLGDNIAIPYGRHNSWEEVARFIKANYDVALIKPVYMYDHGDITINTKPFSCSWDSGQIGWAFITKTKLRELGLMKRNLTKRAIKSAEGIIEGEIYEYDCYLRNDIWGYRLSDREDETVDECWGYCGELNAEAAARNAMHENIKALGPHAL